MPVPELFDSGVNRDASALLASYFQDAADRLKKIVELPPGTTAKSKEFRASFAAQKIAQIDRILLPLKASASGWVGKFIPQAFRAGIALGEKQAAEAGVTGSSQLLAGNFSLIDARTVQQFALSTIGDLHKAADSMADRTRDVLRRQADLGVSNADVNRILAGGVIEGQPVAAIRDYREALRAVHGNEVAIATKNGGVINFKVGYYAQMVARTKTRQASVQARHGRLESLGLSLVVIIGRVSKNFCTAFLGEVFSLDGRSSQYPAYSSLPGGGPPFHPNCSKSTRPFVEALADKGQIEAADGIAGADQLLGMTPTQAQRSFKDLQLEKPARENYDRSVKALLA